MMNVKHKYGPFKKNEDKFYRVCLKCGKKTQYPFNDEINDEFNNQRITDYIIDTIIRKDFSLVQNGNYFFRLVSCLLDNISYIFIDTKVQDILIKSLRDLNDYFNFDDENRFNIINDIICYLEDFFVNYNNEINDLYDDNLCDELDSRYIVLNNSVEIELNGIILSEDNTVVEIEDDVDEVASEIDISLNEIENESE